MTCCLHCALVRTTKTTIWILHIHPMSMWVFLPQSINMHVQSDWRPGESVRMAGWIEVGIYITVQWLTGQTDIGWNHLVLRGNLRNTKQWRWRPSQWKCSQVWLKPAAQPALGYNPIGSICSYRTEQAEHHFIPSDPHNRHVGSLQSASLSGIRRVSNMCRLDSPPPSWWSAEIWER